MRYVCAALSLVGCVLVACGSITSPQWRNAVGRASDAAMPSAVRMSDAAVAAPTELTCVPGEHQDGRRCSTPPDPVVVPARSGAGGSSTAMASGAGAVAPPISAGRGGSASGGYVPNAGHCAECAASRAICDGLLGSTSSVDPFMAGAPRKDVCGHVLTCVEIQPVPRSCFCRSPWEPMPPSTCNTWCGELITFASEWPRSVALKDECPDPLSPAGAAYEVVKTCHKPFCYDECIVSPKAHTSAAGSSATGDDAGEPMDDGGVAAMTASASAMDNPGTASGSSSRHNRYPSCSECVEDIDYQCTARPVPREATKP